MIASGFLCNAACHAAAIFSGDVPMPILVTVQPTLAAAACTAVPSEAQSGNAHCSNTRCLPFGTPPWIGVVMPMLLGLTASFWTSAARRWEPPLVTAAELEAFSELEPQAASAAISATVPAAEVARLTACVCVYLMNYLLLTGSQTAVLHPGRHRRPV